ncbi:VOC family protein [Occultella kanbiaonis]|uniref:VOC family protein n=1 Tax=Occultella kanbiaonis TaxID=2675754 RepID=UPI0013D18DCF|nr:VOC family protein [Occultella kanbiaonis]
MVTFDGMVAFCTDIRASAAFYEHLGLVEDWRDDNHIAFHLPTKNAPEGAWLLLHPRTDHQVPHDLGTFTVPDVDATVAALRSGGYRILNGPADAPWGVREANVVDADGNGLTLVTPLG